MKITFSGPRSEIEALRESLIAGGEMEKVGRTKPYSADPAHQEKFSVVTGHGVLSIGFKPEKGC